MESGIFTDTVSIRILERKPVRRSIAAHVVTLQVLYSYCLTHSSKNMLIKADNVMLLLEISVNPGKGKTETQYDMYITNYRTNKLTFKLLRSEKHSAT